MQKTIDTIVGASGMGAIELVQNADIPDLQAGSGLVTAIFQAIIAVVTLIGLLRKKRV